jgi:hypothetical protein
VPYSLLAIGQPFSWTVTDYFDRLWWWKVNTSTARRDGTNWPVLGTASVYPAPADWRQRRAR